MTIRTKIYNHLRLYDRINLILHIIKTNYSLSNPVVCWTNMICGPRHSVRGQSLRSDVSIPGAYSPLIEAFYGIDFDGRSQYISNGIKPSVQYLSTVRFQRRILKLFFIGICCIYLVSCGTTRRYYKSDAAAGTGEAIEDGVASWYGPNFHGNLTANGEVYNMYSMTAAHRTLPFNSMVRVRNLDNGKSVVVRINDRGPFVKNRIIDLSRKAAAEIGMLGPGTARVRLYLVRGDLKQARSSNLKVATYTVQLGSFRTERSALDRSRKIKNSRVEKAYLNNGEPVYRVYYGVYTQRTRAEREQRKLERQGYSGYVKQLEN